MNPEPWTQQEPSHNRPYNLSTKNRTLIPEPAVIQQVDALTACLIP